MEQIYGQDLKNINKFKDDFFKTKEKNIIMEVSTTDILKKFKSDLINFLDELIESFPDESDFVFSRIMLKDQIIIEDVMSEFIKTILPRKKEVKERNDQFLIEYGFTLFSDNKDKVERFRKLWNTVSKENKKIIWSWFDNFIYISEMYIKTKNSK